MELDLPFWLTALDRKRIERASARATALMVVVDLSLVYPSDAVAVQAALIELEAIAAALLRHVDRHAEDLRSIADGLREQVTVETDRRRLVTGGIDEFVAAIEEALETRPWWLALLEAVTASVVARKTRTRAPREYADRAHIVLPLLDELEWTPTRWATEAGVDPHVTLGYLKGTSTPRTVTRNRITYVLAKALKRITLQLPD